MSAEDFAIKKAIPFSWAYPLIAGVAGGMLLRFIFSGRPGGAWSAMAGAFIYLSPILVGAITVYVAETQKRRSWGYYIVAPYVANCLYVLGTLLILIEGLICAVIIVPMFALLGSLGGLAMGAVCRTTNWPKQTLYSLAVIPLFLGMVGDQLPSPQVLNSIQRSTVVHATPEQVWSHLNRAVDIQPAEFGATWAARIGVPMPLSGVTEMTKEGLVRKSLWNKAVHFDEPISDWQPNRYLRWSYRFFEDSFPPHALDDHVMIGGHYFDLKDTSFTLTPVANGTRLDIEAHYRVSTQLNFYADRVAQLLLGNMMETGLQFYKNRSEKPVVSPSTNALPKAVPTT
ncbi:MAG: polyketide cyclase [Burkholderiales bacterium PBB3]|nr:MAG: polyketide cyclase [Burkholderiales bacterium PBB3]